MKLWTELTLAEQTRALGWRYQLDLGEITNPKTGETLRGTQVPLPGGGYTYTGVTTAWTQWCRDNPDQLVQAVEDHNAGLPPMRWSPRRGDWLVYTRVAPRGGTYRCACSGDVVRWDSWVTEITLEDEAERTVARVQGWYGGFKRPKQVAWTAHPEHGELRLATPDEIRVAREDWAAKDRLAWGGAR